MPDYNPWAQPIFPNGAAFGTGSPAETSTQPAGAADLAGSLYNYFGNLAKQAFGASEDMRQGGDYNPKPALEAAMLPMGTGAIAGVPMRAGEAVLGAGPIRTTALPMDEASRAARATEQGFGDNALRNVWAGKMLDDPQYGQYAHVIERNKPIEREWYHGTQAPEFDEFKFGGVNRQTKDWNTMLGPHFSDSPGVADVFAGGHYTGKSEGGRIMPVQLNVQNPKVYKTETDLSDDAVRWGLEKGLLKPEDFLRGGSDTRGLAANIVDGKLPDWAYGFGGEVLKGAGAKRKQIADGFRNELTAAGHDGIVYGNNVEGTATSAAIPFASNQIRSRFAAFDPANKDSGKLLGGLAGLGLLSPFFAAATGEQKL